MTDFHYYHRQKQPTASAGSSVRTAMGTIPLSRTTKFIVDNRGKTPPCVSNGIKLIATNCVCNDRLYPTNDKLRFVTEETYRTWFRAHPEPNDILLTLKGSQNGAVCLVPANVDFAIAQDMVALRVDEDIIDPHFLLAALRSPAVQDQIKNLDVSGIIPHLKKSDFDKLLIPYPDRQIRELVGRVYFDFSSKIELNRRMNETLEAMARRLFKSWFVDFDPVHSKAALRREHPQLSNADISCRALPNMAPEIAELFPDSFEDSKLGKIPKGWKITRIDEVSEINGWTLGKNDDLEFIDYIEISQVMRGDMGEITRYKRGDEPSRARRRLRNGDVVLSTVRPDRGAYFLAINPPASLIASTGFAVFTSTKVPWSWMSCALTSPEVFEYLGHLADGGAYPAINPVLIGKMEYALPVEVNVLNTFHSLASGWLTISEERRRESKHLGKTRDKLLPSLLSGELSIDTEVA